MTTISSHAVKTGADKSVDTMNIVPNPGSDLALANGCTCPRMDNSYGAGRGGDGDKYGWWKNDNCPLHGLAKDDMED